MAKQTTETPRATIPKPNRAPRVQGLWSWLVDGGGPRAIVPREGVASSSLGILVGIMAFLASLTIGAVFMVSETATGWQKDITREITIQIPVTAGRDLDADTSRAMDIAEATAGVTGVSKVDQKAGAALLEPWLGTDIDLSTLPVPALLIVSISPTDPPDFLGLKAALAQAVPDAILDTHNLWLGELKRMADTMIFIGLGVFFMVMMASVTTVVFATRGAMAGNKDVIEVLHFVGAERAYIASQFQNHFLRIGLIGSVFGSGAALICFGLGNFWLRNRHTGAAGEQVAALFGTFSFGPTGLFATASIVLVMTFLTAITSRWTVLRHVGTLDASSQAASR